MSVCGHYPNHELASQKTSNVIIQDELAWGTLYRQYKKKEKELSVPPKKSPIDIPFKLCREKQRQRLKKTHSKTSIKPKDKSIGEKHPTLLEKSIMSQNQYMDYLATPRKITRPPSPKKRQRPCEIEPCPPRFVQLAVPKKRRVYENWKAYNEVLPTEVIVRYEKLLHTDKNLEPREARYYYKKLDKKKKKDLMKKRRLRKKKQAEKEKGDKAWMKQQVDMTADAIMEYIKAEPLYSLNYKQVTLSDGILDMLDKSELIKKPRRSTRNHYNKTIIEIADKLAVWIDTLMRFVDVQAIDSEEDIPCISISLLEEEEEEGEEEEEEESETESEEICFETGVEEQLKMSLLAQLIQLLENSPQEVLDSFVDEMNFPYVTYNDILEKLKGLQPEMSVRQQKMNLMEDVLIKWARKIDSKKVTKKILREIHNAAAILGEWWKGSIVIEEPFIRREVGLLESAILEEILHEELSSSEDRTLEEIIREQMDQWDEDEETSEESVTIIEEPKEEVVGSGEEAEEEEDKEKKEVEEEEAGKVEAETEPEVETEEKEEEEEEREEKEKEREEEEKEREEEEKEREEEEKEREEEEREREEEKAEEEREKEEEKAEEEREKEEEKAEEEREKEEEIAEEEREKEEEEREKEEEEKEKEREEKEREEEEREKEKEGEGEKEGTPDIITEDVEEEEKGPESEAESEEGEKAEEVEETVEEIGEAEEEIEEEFFGESEEEIPVPKEIEPRMIEMEYSVVEEVEEVPEPPREPPRKEVEPPLKKLSVIYGMEIKAPGIIKVIKAHKPLSTSNHSPDMVCCLSLKTYAVWLLDMTHNAHNWTKWMHGVVHQIGEFAAIIKGNVVGPDGKKKVLYKQEWRDFCKEILEMITAWRKYSSQVRELTKDILDDIKGKTVKCCPQCLKDHLINDVVAAHETQQALAEAMYTAGFWEHTLDQIVERMCALAGIKEVETKLEKEQESSEEDEGESDDYIEELSSESDDDDDNSEVSDFEEINVPK